MSGTVTDRSRSRVDPEEVAVLYIQRRGRKTKFQWGPVTKEEGGGGQEKEQELGQQKELGREKELDQEKGVEGEQCSDYMMKRSIGLSLCYPNNHISGNLKH